MSVTLDQVEKLREKADVTYEEAKNALEISDGDLLEAVLLLERDGKINKVGGSYSTPRAIQGKVVNSNGESSGNSNFWEGVKKVFKDIGNFLSRMITVGGNNYLDVYQDDRLAFSISILAFILLALLVFWAVLPLMIVSLFFRFRYKVRGEELGNDKVNEVLDKTADAFQQVVE